jgi:hypothetical protein
MPTPCRDDGSVFRRDAGLLCIGLQQIGVESRFVTLAGRTPAPDDARIIVATREEMRDARWWKQWNAEGVILFTWADPQYEPEAAAVKQAGCRLVVRVDSDGILSPRVGFWSSLARSYAVFREQQPPVISAILAAAKTAAYGAFAALYDRPLLRLLSHADVIGIESPLARVRLERWARSLGTDPLAGRVKVIPSSVPDDMDYSPGTKRERAVVAVGRWEAYQKDAPRLVRVLGGALARRPEYAARIAGSGGDILERALRRLPLPVRNRVEVVGAVPNESIAALYQKSRILFLSSRYESFHRASGEALCCGCSVVGPSAIATVPYFCSCASGTAAASRRAADLEDALCMEMDVWDDGRRDPAQISAHWRTEFHTDKVVAGIIAC